MKYLKSILLSLILCLVASTGYAQATDEVTLTVSSDGLTKEEATRNALRSAIEQAYGTFVSANTTILNDELVKDEIVTIANGNIKSYEEISSTAMPDSSYFVTLKATVSVSKLISYAQSKGAETEFAGATFGMNMRLQEMNKENEKKVLDNLMTQIKTMLPYAYDRTLEVKDPAIDKNDPSLIRMEFIVTNNPNNNMTEIVKLIKDTFKSISLLPEERTQYKSMNVPYYPRAYTYLKHPYGGPRQPVVPYYFRNSNDDWFVELFQLLILENYQFRITDNLQEVSYIVPILPNDGNIIDNRSESQDIVCLWPEHPGSKIKYAKYGLFDNSETETSYLNSQLPVFYLINGKLNREYIDYSEIRPEEVVIQISTCIQQSEISKSNNFRVERSDLNYE